LDQPSWPSASRLASNRSSENHSLSAAASRGGKLTHAEKRYGDIGRADVREKSVLQALMMLKAMTEAE
jgi:hypothetical protein